jgi:glycine/D-amino acid oxidase-like deaminating enzyme
VDVAIVGGGITGATTAWMFANAGVDVALVDGRRAGYGSTAASTALLMQEPDEDFTRLADRYGDARTRRIWHMSRRATRDFIATLRTLRISCDVRERDSVYFTESDDHESRLRRELRRRHAAGIGGRWLDRAAVRRVAGLDAAAAIQTSGDAQIDPFRACTGLLHAAANSGARIFERSEVTAIRTSRDAVAVTAGRGVVHARRVIIATGYATPYFKPLAARFSMLNTYVAVTRPLTEGERRRIGLTSVMLWDTGRPYYYARWTPDHRLMLGGGDRPLLPDRQRQALVHPRAQRVVDHFVTLYPALADIGIDREWEGLFATTPDGLPYIGPHRRYPNHLFALGYGGNGITFGHLAAQLLLEWYRGRRTNDHDLFAFSR